MVRVLSLRGLIVRFLCLIDDVGMVDFHILNHNQSMSLNGNFGKA